MAHVAVVEWTIAMSSLELPPYVLEHLFDSFKEERSENVYQRRIGTRFLTVPEITEKSRAIDENFFHLIVEERTHLENIKIFISVQKAFQRTRKK